VADSIKVRTAIGLTLIAAITGLLAVDHYTGHGWGVIILAVALVAGGAAEYARMVRGTCPVPARALILASTGYILLKGAGYELAPWLGTLALPFALAAGYGVLFLHLRGAPSQERFRGLAAASFGFLYLPILGGFALDARFLPGGGHLGADAGVDPMRLGEAAFFYIVAIAKGTDICAYFAGKLLGRTKVVPSVSPGKTVAGFVGALAGGVLITGLFSAFSSLGALVALPLVPGVGIVMALVVISGDLVESFLKRSVEVKDSANLLPNFGGVLDVIDSVVFAAPVVYYLLAGLAWLREVSP